VCGVPGTYARPVSAPVLLAHGLVRRHGQLLAVDGVDLELRRGEVLGLLGPNGAGKTTVVRLITGLLRPARGTVTLDGRALTPALAAGFIAYLPQSDLVLEEVPVALAVEQTARLRGLGRTEARAVTGAVLDELGLTGLGSRPCGQLSGGQRRLAAVAVALAGTRSILVLDEPTSGLDAEARLLVWQALQRRRDAGAGILLVTHDVVEAETVLDRVTVLSAGRVLACDTPGRVKALVGDEVRLELVWRAAPPLGDPVVAQLRERCRVTGNRWSARMPAHEARSVLGWLTTGATLQSLDDFTLATPTLADAYLRLGGIAGAWEAAA
jgi:ABC-2 type transport system ATP-binding protein